MEQTEQQYVTIKEFATLANVTTQAVYKRLNQTDSSLNKFVKYNGKMKLISKDALELFADAPVNQQGEGDGIYEDISLQAQTTLFSSYFDAQQLHRAEQEQFRLIAADTTKEEKKGFFKRLFHKKDVETSEA